MVLLAILSAVIVVLQLIGTFVKLPGGISLNLTLIPITLGAIVLGPWAGLFLGFVCGVVILVGGLTGADPFTFALLQLQPVMTVVICLSKTMLAGLCSGFVHRALEKKHPFAATVVSAVVTPFVNTVLFLVLALLIADSVVSVLGNPAYENVLVLFVTTFVTTNFVIELVLNLILTPAVHRLWLLAGKKRTNLR